MTVKNPKELRRPITSQADRDRVREYILSGVEIDFRGLDLRRCDLRGLDLRGKNFSDAQIEGTNFDHSDLREARISCTRINGTTFRFANMENCTLACREDYCLTADFRGANLRMARIGAWPSSIGKMGAFLNVRNSNFYGADLSFTAISRSSWEGTVVEGALFTNSVIGWGDKFAPEYLRNAIGTYIS